MSKKQDKKEEKNEEDIVNDDITIEVDEENMKESSFGGDIKKIREKLKSCTEEKQEYLAGW